ncbi:hypothetical protein LC1Hm_1621 [Halomicrobium sp. LC1Hm]|nr:hypothetical protein LC1Hm_1621 [Halomicrobium sp. LC1Hm]
MGAVAPPTGWLITAALVVEHLGRRSDTAGCTFVKIFATPGWRNRSQMYSR